MKMFFQITKADERTGLVTGRAVQEVVDHAGEIFDYAKSKPHFEAWSSGIAKATDGKSQGNVRAMHGKVSAGVVKDIQFLDTEKAIDITALINDPVEKRKLMDGNYTGFSIGGTYVDKWEDPEHTGVMRYEAQPSEISIVDLPCIPTATFTAIKSDGSEELRKFHVEAEAPAETVEKSAAGEGTSDTSTIREVEPPAADPAKAIDPKLAKRAEKLVKNEGAHRILDTVRAAYGLAAPVEKGLYDVAELADLISWLTMLADCAEGEAKWEGDNSKVPDELRASVRQLGAILLEMAQEEIEEAVGGEGDVEVIVEMAAKIGELAKGDDAAAKDEAYRALGKALGIVEPPPVPAPKPELSKVQRAVLDETTHALSKSRDDLKKALADNETLTKRVAELEKLPAAKAPHLRVVAKNGEVEDFGPADGAAPDEVEPVVVGGKVDDFATKIKKMHANRGQISK